jgi:cytidine deaminase
MTPAPAPAEPPSAELLVAEARRAMEHAHAPYSRFPVGAALLVDSGRVYRGANVENASLGLSICAERSAVFAAIAAGERGFRALAIATDTERPTPPCGACRQVLREFVDDLPIYLAGRDGPAVVRRLRDLLPEAFTSNPGDRSKPFGA